jgi:hypothetical protein
MQAAATVTCLVRVATSRLQLQQDGPHLKVNLKGHCCNSVPMVGSVLGGGPAGPCCGADWLLLPLQGRGATAADRRPRRCLLLTGLLLCFCCHSAAAAAVMRSRHQQEF